MNLSFHAVRRITATALTVGLAAGGLLMTGCTAQNTADKVVSGTIMGSDGKIVDALIGFAVQDAGGHVLDLGGPKVGYSVVERVNHCVPTDGAAQSQTCPKTGYVTGYNWSLRVPYNAYKIYIEVYPKAPTSTNFINSPSYTGPMTGVTNTSTYSLTYRSATLVPTSLSGIKLVLPKICGAPGGQTGTLYGHIAHWPAGKTGTADAWSMTPNTQPMQGFGLGLVDKDGNYTINGLVPGQHYGIIAGTAGFSRNTVTYANSISRSTLVAHSCARQQFDF